MPKKLTGTAVDRLKDRVLSRLDSDKHKPQGMRRTQQGLAEKLGISKGTLNDLLNGPSATRGLLHHLDAIADYFGVTPTLLVHRNDTNLIELTSQEYRFVTHVRHFSPAVNEQILMLFDFFGGLLPEEQDQRRWWAKMRRLRNPRDREYLERTLDDLLRAQRTVRGERAGPAAPDSSAATSRPTLAPVTQPKRTGAGK